MKKLNNIELLRSLLILFIVIHHMSMSRDWTIFGMLPDVDFYRILHNMFKTANNAVEAFFIISGFFLGYKFSRSTGLKNFIIGKYIRMSPAILFGLVITFIVCISVDLKYDFFANLLTLLLLNNFIIDFAIGQDPVLWYTSALFAGLILFFCCMKYVPSKYVSPVIALLSASGYITLEILQHGAFYHPLKNYGVLNIGFLRAIGGIGLGSLIGICYKNNLDRINSFKPEMFQKVLFTLMELVSFSLFIWWMAFDHVKLNNIVPVIIFAVLFMLFIVKKGFLSNFLDRDIWIKTGKYQYSIYVIHYVLIEYFGLSIIGANLNFVRAHPVIPLLGMFFVIILMGMLCYHIIEKPCGNYLKNKFLR